MLKLQDADNGASHVIGQQGLSVLQLWLVCWLTLFITMFTITWQLISLSLTGVVQLDSTDEIAPILINVYIIP